jgi:hypothetical protein
LVAINASRERISASRDGASIEPVELRRGDLTVAVVHDAPMSAPDQGAGLAVADVSGSC